MYRVVVDEPGEVRVAIWKWTFGIVKLSTGRRIFIQEIRSRVDCNFKRWARIVIQIELKIKFIIKIGCNLDVTTRCRDV